MMFLFGGSNATFFTLPTYHGSARSKTAFEDFIPSDNLSTF